MQEIQLDHVKLQYCGRVNDNNKNKPEFIFTSTSLKFRFFGKKAVLTVRNRNIYWNNYVGVIVNGVQTSIPINKEGTTEIVLVDGEEKEYTILFFKRMDSCHEIILEKLEISTGGILLEVEEKPTRKIEVYGDSVSAGEVSEAVEYVGKEDPPHQGEYSNSWYSYSWILARKLSAQIHNISQGGVALLDGTGWFSPPEYRGIRKIWDKVNYVEETESVLWDFSKYTPHLVIVAIGQNDNHPFDYMGEDIESEQAQNWREQYKHWIMDIRKQYKNAVIILKTTILNHHKNWDDSIERVCFELNDNKIFHFRYSNNGCGTPGHIRSVEAIKMADELYQYIEKLNEHIDIFDERT